MFDEHVKVTMGLDRGPFDRGLKGARGSLDVFKGAIGALGVHFGLGAAAHFVESLLQMGNELKATAESAGVTTDFLQGFQHGADQTGSSSEKATELLTKFTKTLAEAGMEGADVEGEINKVADRMAATNDPVKRAEIAFDAFGKKASQLIPLLSQGSEGLRKYREEAHKLSAEEVQTLDVLDKRLKEVEHNVKISGGHVVGFFFRMVEAAGAASAAMGAHPETPFFDRFFQAMGTASVQIDAAAKASEADAEAKRKSAQAAAAAAASQNALTIAYAEAEKSQQEADFDAAAAGDQLNAMLAFRKHLLDEIAHKPDPSVENAKRLVALAKLQKDIGDKIKTVEAARLKIAERQESIFEASAKLSDAQADAERSRRDRSGLTLQDLANMTPESRAGAQNAFQARQALNAEEFAKRARANGRPDLAKQATDFALGVRSGLEPLTDSERDPMHGVAEATAKSAESLQKLLDKAEGPGINVNNSMGN